ncbi:hypothetical protein HMPREF1531_01271 [Propionibacterium sp. oral taxon 192 str. F0372]|uniref:PfkB family carbohydrate kinase n=1 Tax=Propionibacterium sp. oral taxon 192 TaxID=671222 RepID=UPI0003549994|nr:PfkB family carbohydrate kinase [Propionibacterium sp. oral taxon 192]EPH03214.1 hypothetical protein HMPREF1531_01271 [Propionibacterium sp. oral taxon 192 str. F0372]
MNEPRIWSLASVMIDQTIEVPHYPGRGSAVLATTCRYEVGGGFNLASAVARQGAACNYGGTYGVGRNSELALRAMAAEGIEVVLAPDERGDGGVCLIIVDPDGERTFIPVAGVESQRRLDQLTALPIVDEDWVSISGYDLNFPVSGESIHQWLQGDPAGRLFLDPGPVVADIPAERMRTVLDRIEVLSCNQREAQLLCGCDDTGANLVARVRAEVEMNPDAMVIVREGPRGCVATGGELGKRIVSVAAPQVRAVDTVGAGDTHCGVFLARMVQGADVEEALGEANAAAADSVTRRGPATAPRRG